MSSMENKELERRITTVMSMLDERQKRIYLAAEAESLGWGGMKKISQIAGVDQDTLTAGKKDLQEHRGEGKNENKVGNISSLRKDGRRRIRREGGGRKDIREKQPGITEALLKLVEGESYGNPENPLLWTTKSVRNLSDELRDEGYRISHTKVGQLLEEEGYTLQSNRKLEQVGTKSPDRDAQFKHINDTCKNYMSQNNPVISIDCKKKENIGNYANNGVEFHEKGEPVAVLDHDFMDKEKGKAIPYGVYDIGSNEGYVNVGISHDTASFAAASILEWWKQMGQQRYPDANRLYITADGGGSNGSRNRLWKVELQGLANTLGMPIEVSHFPAGTSKWNKIEHRLFSFISKNWRGRPLETLEIIVNLIANTTTSKGLTVGCGIDMSDYPTGTKISDEELSNVNIARNEFHGEWNYIIYPANC